jgi:hypothetical protein
VKEVMNLRTPEETGNYLSSSASQKLLNVVKISGEKVAVAYFKVLF